jgi:cytochrome c556
MKRFIASALIFALGLSAAMADDVIAQRRALMKANGDSSKAVVAMLRGAPYDDAAVKAALKTYTDAAAKMPALFPLDSKTGGDTAALPAVWENKADFDARFKKFGEDATAAASSITDAASFKANMPAVLKNCNSCHETYRAKQS